MVGHLRGSVVVILVQYTCAESGREAHFLQCGRDYLAPQETVSTIALRYWCGMSGILRHGGICKCRTKRLLRHRVCRRSQGDLSSRNEGRCAWRVLLWRLGLCHHSFGGRWGCDLGGRRGCGYDSGTAYPLQSSTPDASRQTTGETASPSRAHIAPAMSRGKSGLYPRASPIFS